MPPAKPDSSILNPIFDNTQVPHQALLVVRDPVSFSGRPVFREIIRRALARGETITVIGILNPPEDYLPLHASGVNKLDLTGSVPGYSSTSTASDIKKQILSTYQSGQIFIDALDVLAEDYSAASVVSLLRSLLETIKLLKAPSRLVLLLPSLSVLSHITPPTFHPTLTLLTPHPPPLLTYLSKLYLSPISSSPSANYWMILENATKRETGKELALRGEEGLEVSTGSSWGVGSGCVQVLVRKATGGMKGISRSLEALSPTSSQSLSTVPLSSLVPLNPLRHSSTGPPPTANNPSTSTAQTHAELDLPFNLSLTDSQRRQRDSVPIPYAHEGEGASGDLVWEDEEETDDEEI
ncbi:hypothetical protein I350_03924 [Cryptococcus amylolentus CBS 6273]|uniref:Elongator complex protein 5 n=1 Tax=Cryptococcus amylolentus CBS 6273 TaxID=1296118 RepID=A0A1E3K0B2_9TREE|nr:hypothetical protein I350_03924 [Cryptococcus amylolentus CBS 6273]